MAGRLPRALLAHFLARRWLRRVPGERALEMTSTGQATLGSWLDAPR